MSMIPIPQETFRSAMKAEPRPMTGFLATLTPEQQQRARDYRGDETHGDDAYRNVEPGVSWNRAYALRSSIWTAFAAAMGWL